MSHTSLYAEVFQLSKETQQIFFFRRLKKKKVSHIES